MLTAFDRPSSVITSTTNGPYDIGHPVDIVFSCQKGSDLSYIDPTTIVVKVLPPGPGAARITLTSPDPAIIKDAVGQYYVSLDTTTWSYGRALYRIETSGTLLGAIDGHFDLTPSSLSP